MSQSTPESLVQGSIQLFTLPDIYLQIHQLLNNPQTSANDIGAAISKDPALSARLLRIVNSSYYSFKARIDTISRAITIVGIDDLQNLVLATSVIDKFSKIPCDQIDITDFWLRSVNCGLIAKLLAKKRTVLHCERLFLAGLLHDIGSLILYNKMPDESLQVLLAANHDRRLIPDLEREIFGFTHASVGGELIKTWGLPESLSEAISFYLNPEMAHVHKLDTHILHVASRLCDINTLGIPVDEVLLEIPTEVLNYINLDETAILQVMEQATEEFSQVFDNIGLGWRDK